MTAYALPGLMPVGSPKADSRLTHPWEQPLSLLLFSEPEEQSEKSCTWWLELQGSSGLVLRQKGADNVLTHVSGGYRYYTLHLLPRSLPPGTHLFEADIDGTLVQKRVTIPRTVDNTLRPRVLVESQDTGEV